MKHLGILKPDTLVNMLNLIGLPVVIIYVFCMFVWPWISGNGEWIYVQAVWDRWQGLNVGMLAFISSVIAFNISRYNAEKQRSRDFLAAKAFLPAAMSELITYFINSARVFNLVWESRDDGNQNLEIPELPQEYKSVFRDCIRHAEPNVGDNLSRILVWLQIHDSRMRGYAERHRGNGGSRSDRRNLITYFYRLGELQALINKLFDFARNMDEFDSSPLNWEDFRNAYCGLGLTIENIYVDEEMNLEAFTKRQITRHSSQNT
ncbi:hypothetical protein ACNJYG_19010 [Pseudomonas sp. GW6]|nr:hypothetical protein [Pseudomonas chengduensis]MDH1867170.1 hypothetical protein [Pseudomonas chengduensis]